MVKKLLNLFNKRKREIERLEHVVVELNTKNAALESNLRTAIAKNSLLEREKDSLVNKVKGYEDQVKILNLTIGDLSRTDNNSRYY